MMRGMLRGGVAVLATAVMLAFGQAATATHHDTITLQPGQTYSGQLDFPSVASVRMDGSGWSLRMQSPYCSVHSFWGLTCAAGTHSYQVTARKIKENGLWVNEPGYMPEARFVCTNHPDFEG